MIYSIIGSLLNSAYNVNGVGLQSAYDVNGNTIFSSGDVDYTDYSYVQKWGSKGFSTAQGFDIFDDKVFWVDKSGDSTVPANMYVYNLSDGGQALPTAYITVYSGHGNNICFSKDSDELIATPAYPPSRIYINSFTSNYTMTLEKTLVLNDGSTDCDACYDPTDNNYMWSLGHTANSQDRSAPFKVSKWDLSQLTDNGDGTYTPENISTIQIPQPSNSYFFQGCKFHDGLLWFASGNGTGSSYVYAVNPTTGNTDYTIDLQTTQEPEGVSWVAEQGVVGGYAMYVGFQGMMLRKYTFGALT